MCWLSGEHFVNLSKVQVREDLKASVHKLRSSRQKAPQQAHKLSNNKQPVEVGEPQGDPSVLKLE
jgi:hypothetical protein